MQARCSSSFTLRSLPLSPGTVQVGHRDGIPSAEQAHTQQLAEVADPGESDPDLRRDRRLHYTSA